MTPRLNIVLLEIIMEALHSLNYLIVDVNLKPLLMDMNVNKQTSQKNYEQILKYIYYFS